MKDNPAETSENDQGPGRHSQVQLQAILDIAHGGFYTVAKDGTTLLCNKGFMTMLGFNAKEDAVGKKLHGAIHHSHANGTHYEVTDCPIYVCASQGKPAHVDDEFFYKLDGTPVPVEYWVHPILTESGEPDGAVCTFIDITERRRAQDLQQQLSHELAHRIKNMLAMVQAIVRQSLRNAKSVEIARDAIGERLGALANAHDILTQTSWVAAPLHALAKAAIAPHIGATRRIRFHGPDLEVAAGPALSLAMAVHELAMNAAKYGALSNDSGVVDLTWSVSGTGPQAGFSMLWRESGGPVVTAPQLTGFGSRLIGGSFGADFGGKAELSYPASGVEWCLQAPLAGVKQP